MKLAEALLLRADLQTKLASLRERIGRYAVVQEGQKPQEDPAQLMKEAHGVLEQTEQLVFRINRANLNHQLDDGRSLTEALARRDMLIQRHSLIQSALAGAKKEPDRYGLKEIAWVSTLNIPSLQKQADDLSRQIRELNATIQQTNWNVELEEPAAPAKAKPAKRKKTAK